MKKFLFNKLSLKEYNMLASAPFELTTETEKAVLVKFTTEKGTKSIWIPKSVLKDTQPAETNENNFLVKGQKYKHRIIRGDEMLIKIKEIVTEKEMEKNFFGNKSVS